MTQNVILLHVVSSMYFSSYIILIRSYESLKISFVNRAALYLPKHISSFKMTTKKVQSVVFVCCMPLIFYNIEQRELHQKTIGCYSIINCSCEFSLEDVNCDFTVFTS